MTMEQVETLERNETKLVGYKVTASLNQVLETSIVGKLREELFGKRNEIANRIDDKGIYLVQVYEEVEWTPDVPFTSIVAVEVSDFAHMQGEFVQHTIPAGKYVKVTHKGPESQIGSTYDTIHTEGISGPRPFDFEYWADIHTLALEESTIAIYFPE